jgi:hypothetical protein
VTGQRYRYRAAAICLAMVMHAGGTAAETVESTATQSEQDALPAKSTKSPFSVELTVGVEYDDTLAVLDLDQSTTQDDVRLLLGADFGYKHALSDSVEAKAGYSYSRSIHEAFSDFDIETHLVTGELKKDFGAFDAGAAYRFVSTQLGSDPFLELHQFAPYVYRLFGKTAFVRGGYTATRKLFKGRSDRDATTQDADINVYWFLDGIRRYVRVGYRFTAENTNEARFDHFGHTARLRFSQRFDLLGRNAAFKAGLRYEERNFRSITPALGEERLDQRLSFDTSLEVDIARHWFVVARYRHGANSSNLATVDFNENRVSMTVGYRR